jgi:serine/threonine protein kinase
MTCIDDAEISLLAKDFLRQLLAPLAASRISVQDAMQHPWIQAIYSVTEDAEATVSVVVKQQPATTPLQSTPLPPGDMKMLIERRDLARREKLDAVRNNPSTPRSGGQLGRAVLNLQSSPDLRPRKFKDKSTRYVVLIV